MPADRNLSHLYPAFEAKVVLVLADMNAYASKHMLGYSWAVNEGFRTAEYQQMLYQQGRTRAGQIVTYRDGIHKRSNHQSSLAADLVPKHGWEWDWSVANQHWDYLGHCARAHGLKWGGDWDKPDRPHIEWPEEDKATYAAAQKWQRENGLA
jgi:peptidoglycan L-alanyl-D-glutamate endopeptidase CwlK